MYTNFLKPADRIFLRNVTINHKFQTVLNTDQFLISSFRRALYVVCFLLGNSQAPRVYIPTFRNTLSVPPSQAGRCQQNYTHIYLLMKVEHTECSETSAYKLQAPENYPKESIQQPDQSLFKLNLTHFIRCIYYFTSLHVWITQCPVPTNLLVNTFPILLKFIH